jgi:anti-sigma B factor antagonist
MDAPAGQPPFDVQHRRLDERPHAFEITVTGDIDMSSAAALDEVLDDVLDAGASFVVLDLSAVSFLDSSGLRSIVRASRALAERDGQLTCAGLSGAASRVLEISGLLEHLRAEAPDAST